MNLNEEIISLIESKREGDYWDFKEFPHEDKTKLLHDILCFANVTNKRNCFIVIGVSDDYKIKGLTKNQENRREQSELIDFLNSKKFLGGIKPEIGLNTILIDGCEIDVITIYDKPNKPYLLLEDYKENKNRVRSNYIYTRIGDTNTPIDKTASLYAIEKMWKERFGIDLSPIERMKQLLPNSKDWSYDIGNSKLIYHKQYPEFTIKLGKNKSKYQTYSFFQFNHTSFIGKLNFYHFNTKLFKSNYIYIDEVRNILPFPKVAIVDGDYRKRFYYFILDDLEGAFLQFLFNREDKLAINTEIVEPFVLFKNDIELSEFIRSLKGLESFREENRQHLNVNHIKQVMKDYSFNSHFDVEYIMSIYKFWRKNNFNQI